MCAIAEICREGGGATSTSQLPTEATHAAWKSSRRFDGSQLAIDATVVSPLRADGTHRRKSDTTDGQALAEARKHKERTCPVGMVARGWW